MHDAGRIIRKLLALAALAVVVCQAGCNHPAMRELTMAFAPKVVMDADNKPLLRYRLLEPATIEPGVTYPLIVVLHGAGERGDDNSQQLAHGAAELLHYTRSRPAFVIFPQCPRGTWWDREDRKYAINGNVPMAQVIKLVDRFMRDRPVDPSRVYITGMSMGGFATFTAVAARPELFAAALPVCGGGNPHWAGRYFSTPFWITHGGSDPMVSPKESRTMVSAMESAGVNVRYSEFRGVGHDAWTPTYSSENVLDWLFSQRKGMTQSAATPAKRTEAMGGGDL